MIAIDWLSDEPPEAWVREAVWINRNKQIGSWVTKWNQDSQFEELPKAYDISRLLTHGKIGLDLFSSRFLEKCAYCERRLALHRAKIDLYRPRKLARQTRKGSSESRHRVFYCWLSFEWSNMLLACEHCTSAKDFIFPLAPGKDRLGPDITQFRQLQKLEEPLLINPRFDKPARYLHFNQDGSIKAVNGEPRDRSRGQTTIDTLKLDDTDLTKDREQRAIRLRQDFDEALKQCLENPSASPALEKVTDLTNAGQNDQEFAGMVRQLLYLWNCTELSPALHRKLDASCWKDISKQVNKWFEEAGSPPNWKKENLETEKDPIDIIIDPPDPKEPYTPSIGIITALPEEFAAVKAALSDFNEIDIGGAKYRYFKGYLPATKGGKHEVVLCLTFAGTNPASSTATSITNHFETIKTIIMVGIAGGIPNPEKPSDHVRLGDIVVSGLEGVVQYDFDKETLSEVKTRGRSSRSGPSLLQSARLLQASGQSGDFPWIGHIESISRILNTSRPPAETDILIASDGSNSPLEHPTDNDRFEGQPKVHIGTIASANKLLKNPQKRDTLRDKFGAKAVEMEGSGIADATWMQGVEYLVIRGISDYCDSTKNDTWKKYAAIVAAAYMRALLESMPPLSS